MKILNIKKSEEFRSEQAYSYHFESTVNVLLYYSFITYLICLLIFSIHEVILFLKCFSE